MEKDQSNFKDYYLSFGLLAVLVIISRLIFYGPSLDDGFIYFRYIENFFHGFGLVYNRGELVASLSSPLQSWLLIGLRFLHLPLMPAAAGLGMIFDLLALWLLFKISFELKFHRYLTIGVGLLFALNGWLANYSAAAMESSLTIFLSLSAFYFFLKQKPVFVGVVLGVLALARMEGFLLVGMLVGGNYILEKKIYKSWIAYPVVMYGLWEGILIFYYHKFILDSLKFKFYILHYSGIYASLLKINFAFGFNVYLEFSSALRYFGYLNSRLVSGLLVGGSVIVTLICLFFAMLGVVYAPRILKQATSREIFIIRLMALWALLYDSFYILSGTDVFAWYFLAPLPVYFLLMGLGFWQVDISIRNFVSAQKNRWYLYSFYCLIFFMFVGAMMSVMVLRQVVFNRGRSYIYSEALPAAEWLSKNVPTKQNLAISADGMYGYFAPNVKMLDLHGLVSPEVLAFRREHNLIFTMSAGSGLPDYDEALIVNHFRPNFLMTPYGSDFEKRMSELGQGNLYEKVKVFGPINIYKITQ